MMPVPPETPTGDEFVLHHMHMAEKYRRFVHDCAHHTIDNMSLLPTNLRDPILASKLARAFVIFDQRMDEIAASNKKSRQGGGRAPS